MKPSCQTLLAVGLMVFQGAAQTQAAPTSSAVTTYKVPTEIPSAPYFSTDQYPTITAIQLPDKTLLPGNPGITTDGVSLSLGTAEIVIGTKTLPFATSEAAMYLVLDPTGSSSGATWELNGWAHAALPGYNASATATGPIQVLTGPAPSGFNATLTQTGTVPAVTQASPTTSIVAGAAIRGSNVGTFASSVVAGALALVAMVL